MPELNIDLLKRLCETPDIAGRKPVCDEMAASWSTKSRPTRSAT